MLISFLRMLGVPLYHVVIRAFSYSVKFSCIHLNRIKFSFPPSRSIVCDPQSCIFIIIFFNRPGNHTRFTSSCFLVSCRFRLVIYTCSLCFAFISFCSSVLFNSWIQMFFTNPKRVEALISSPLQSLFLNPVSPNELF